MRESKTPASLAASLVATSRSWTPDTFGGVRSADWVELVMMTSELVACMGSLVLARRGVEYSLM